MNSLKSFWPLIVAAVLGLMIIVMAEPVSNYIAASRTGREGFVVGRITQASGNVKRIHGALTETIGLPIHESVEIHDGDRIQTSSGAKCSVNLNSQDEIEIMPESAVEFQLWNSKDSGSPIYINSVAGSLASHRPGVKGKAYVVREGRLYLPGQTPLKKALALTVLKNAPLDLQLSETTHTGGPDFEADSSPEEPTAPSSDGVDPETLSNEYIDETILAHQGQLQKCWLTRLKDSPALKGQIVVQFEISKRGKIKEMRIADSSLGDDVLQKCVMSVIERISFRPFKGSDISLSYPINFE